MIFCTKIPYMKGFVSFAILFSLSLQGCAYREKMIASSNMHYEYGIYYLHTEELDKALEEFKKATSDNPKNDEAFFGLGLTNYFLGNFSEAVKDYQKAIDINPEVSEYYNNIAAVYVKLKDWDKVIDYAQKTLKDPFYANPEFAYYNIGTAYLNTGRVKEAVDNLSKSKQINPNYIQTDLLLAKAHITNGDYQSALIALNDAKVQKTKMDSGDITLEAEMQYYFGQVYMGIGDKDKAKRSFQFVIDNLPGSELAKEASEFLEHMH